MNVYGTKGGSLDTHLNQTVSNSSHLYQTFRKSSYLSQKVPQLAQFELMIGFWQNLTRLYDNQIQMIFKLPDGDARWWIINGWILPCGGVSSGRNYYIRKKLYPFGFRFIVTLHKCVRHLKSWE